jgi:tape measure domain-containing protein
MSKTVSYANVHLSYTADAAGLRQAKADMAAMNRVINQTKTDTQKYEEHVQKLDRLLANGKITQEQYNQGLEAARKKYIQTNQEVKKAADFQNQYNKALANTKSRLAIQPPTATAQPIKQDMTIFGINPATIAFAAATAASVSEAKKSVAAFGELESTLVTLEVVYGDAKRAAQDFATMRRMAAVSPLEARDFTRAAQVMAQYGVSIEQIIPTLDRISEVAAGNSERMFSLSLAFGQVAANGRLMGQEVLQMVNAGFNPLAEIARTTGRDMRDLRKDMENGLITFEMVANAFRTATDEGGRFSGMNEKLATTVTARFAQIRDEVTKTREAFGELVAAMIPFDATQTGLQGLSFFVSRMKNDFMNMNAAEASMRIMRARRLSDVSFDDMATILGLPGSKGGPSAQEEAARAQNLLGKQLANAANLLPESLKAASEKFVQAFAEFDQLARAGADQATKADVKRRAEAEAERKRKLEREMSDRKFTAELPKLATFGSVEAFGLMSEMAQRKADMQLEQLKKNEEIAVKQVNLLTTIKDNTGKPQMGIVR